MYMFICMSCVSENLLKAQIAKNLKIILILFSILSIHCATTQKKLNY